MTSRLLLYSLLKLAVSDNDSNLSLEKSCSPKVYSLAVSQGIVGIAFFGLKKYMEIHGIKKENLGKSVKVYDRWFATTASIILHHDKITHLQDKLSKYLQEEGIKALVLKGLSIAKYYDNASLRCFGDLDIYSPTDYDKLDEFLKSMSTYLSLDYYRHSECKVNGVIVENHRYLTDIRGQSRFYKLEYFLQGEASASLASIADDGLYYANECFSFVFFVYHALSHFLYEKLSLKFLVDWCMMLKGRNELTDDILDQKLNEFRLMDFAATMTALCVDRLGLQEEFVPKLLLSESKSIKQDLLERFEEDMFVQEYEKFSSNSLQDRLKRGKEFYKKSWKIKEFLNVSTTAFLWEKVCALRKDKLHLK